MRILLGMSGGLDSSYAAHLLMEAGHEVAGAYLIMHGEGELPAARASAEALGIPLYEIDCREEFYRAVILPFAEDYRSGRTPNPCVMCNPRVKIGVLYREMCARGFDRIATGHYARITLQDGRYAAALSQDAKKDQSYVLYRLPQEMLGSLMFPLAELHKQDVRLAAQKEELPALDRAESMEICFLPAGEHAAYLTEHFGSMPEGDFVAEDGCVLGRHRGIQHYTVGQRKGLGIALGERMFVTRIDPETNRITLAPDRDRRVESVRVADLVFSGIAPTSEGEGEFLVRLRYHAPLVRCRVRFVEGRVTATLLDEVRAAAPGQSAVFYTGERIAFGGIIQP